MRWLMLAMVLGSGALMAATPGVTGTNPVPPSTASGYIDLPAPDPPMPPGAADDIMAWMAARRAAMQATTHPGTGTAPSGGTIPENATLPQGGFGGGGGFGTPGGGGGIGGFGGANPPAASLPAGRDAVIFTPDFAAQPGWSREVNGLRIRTQALGWMAAESNMIVHLNFWYGSPGELALCPDDRACWTWEVRNAAGRIVPFVKVPPQEKAVEWDVMTHLGLGRFLSDEPQSDNTEKDVLAAGDRRWKLAPGEYTLRGTFSGPSQLPGRHATIPAWGGKIELAPVTFMVYGKVTPEELAKAAAAIRTQKWTDKGDMYRALVKLIQPGMSGEELLSVLPHGTGEDARWGSVMGTGPGMALASRGTYPLDADYGVEWTGRGAMTGNVAASISAPPRIVSRQEYEQALQSATQRGRGRGAGGQTPASDSTVGGQ
jgi:hypothetical protein